MSALARAQVLDMLGGPDPGWVHIAEEHEQGERHFNPAHVVYVREVPKHGGATF